MDGVTRVHIGEKTIVTALAKDAAKDRGHDLDPGRRLTQTGRGGLEGSRRPASNRGTNI